MGLTFYFLNISAMFDELTHSWSYPAFVLTGLVDYGHESRSICDPRLVQMTGLIKDVSSWQYSSGSLFPVGEGVHQLRVFGLLCLCSQLKLDLGNNKVIVDPSVSPPESPNIQK